MIKKLWLLVYRLATKPGETWEALAEKGESKTTFVDNVFYPLLGVITLSAFIGVFINLREFDVQIALKSAIITCVSLFGGIYASSYAIDKLYTDYVGGETNIDKAFIFSGYCYAPIMILVSIMQLFPDFFFLDIFYLAIPYLVWEGWKHYFQVKESKVKLFVIASSAALLLTPWVLKKLMFILMPGMRL